MTKKKQVRRWRIWDCFEGPDSLKDAEDAIQILKARGVKAKVWAPLPQHKTSGHTHVVVLATWDEYLELAGLRV